MKSVVAGMVIVLGVAVYQGTGPGWGRWVALAALVFGLATAGLVAERLASKRRSGRS